MSIDVTTRVLKSRRPKFIYFARVGEYLKVGCSYNPTQRIRQIRRDNCTKPAGLDPFAPTELLRVVPAGGGPKAFDLEFDYHAALYDYHAAGEWYRAEPEVLAWVADLKPDLRPYDQRPLTP